MTFIELKDGTLVNQEHIVKLTLAAEGYHAAAFLYLSTGEKMEINEDDLSKIKAL